MRDSGDPTGVEEARLHAVLLKQLWHFPHLPLVSVTAKSQGDRASFRLGTKPVLTPEPGFCGETSFVCPKGLGRQVPI